jgi:anti-sigma regulatory factor (Ser/Thr protein kinase)
MVHLRLPATMSSLEAFRAFVLEALGRWHFEKFLWWRVELALEEVLTNIIHYAYPQTDGDVEVGCYLDADGGFCIIVQDSGGPFDPGSREDPDVDQDLLQRPVGGLGIFLVKRMVSEMHYERRGDKNVLTLCFGVPGRDDTACGHEGESRPS